MILAAKLTSFSVRKSYIMDSYMSLTSKVQKSYFASNFNRMDSSFKANSIDVKIILMNITHAGFTLLNDSRIAIFVSIYLHKWILSLIAK